MRMDLLGGGRAHRTLPSSCASSSSSSRPPARCGEEGCARGEPWRVSLPLSLAPISAAVMMLDQPAPQAAVDAALCGVDGASLRALLVSAFADGDAALADSAILAAAEAAGLADCGGGCLVTRSLWRELVAAAAATRSMGNGGALGPWGVLLRESRPETEQLGFRASVAAMRRAAAAFFGPAAAPSDGPDRLCAQLSVPPSLRRARLLRGMHEFVAPVLSAASALSSAPPQAILAEGTLLPRDLDPAAADGTLRLLASARQMSEGTGCAGGVERLLDACGTMGLALHALSSGADAVCAERAGASLAALNRLLGLRGFVDACLFDAAVASEAASLWPRGLPPRPGTEGGAAAADEGDEAACGRALLTASSDSDQDQERDERGGLAGLDLRGANSAKARQANCPSLSELEQSGGRRRPAGSASFQTPNHPRGKARSYTEAEEEVGAPSGLQDAFALPIAEQGFPMEPEPRRDGDGVASGPERGALRAPESRGDSEGVWLANSAGVLLQRSCAGTRDGSSPVGAGAKSAGTGELHANPAGAPPASPGAEPWIRPVPSLSALSVATSVSSSSHPEVGSIAEGMLGGPPPGPRESPDPLRQLLDELRRELRAAFGEAYPAEDVMLRGIPAWGAAPAEPSSREHAVLLRRISRLTLDQVTESPQSRSPGLLLWARLLLFVRHRPVSVAPVLVGMELEARGLLTGVTRFLVALMATDTVTGGPGSSAGPPWASAYLPADPRRAQLDDLAEAARMFAEDGGSPSLRSDFHQSPSLRSDFHQPHSEEGGWKDAEEGRRSRPDCPSSGSEGQSGAHHRSSSSSALTVGSFSYARHLLAARDMCVRRDGAVSFSAHAFFPAQLPRMGADPQLTADPLLPCAGEKARPRDVFAERLAMCGFAAGFRAACATSDVQQLALATRMAGSVEGWFVGFAYRTLGASPARAYSFDFGIRELPPFARPAPVPGSWSTSLSWAAAAPVPRRVCRFFPARPLPLSAAAGDRSTWLPWVGQEVAARTPELCSPPGPPAVPVAPPLPMRHAVLPLRLVRARRLAAAVVYAVLQLPGLRPDRERLSWRVGLSFAESREAMAWLLAEQFVMELSQQRVVPIPLHLAVPLAGKMAAEEVVFVPEAVVALAAARADLFWVYVWLGALGAAASPTSAGARISLRRLASRTQLTPQKCVECFRELARAGWAEVVPPAGRAPGANLSEAAFPPTLPLPGMSDLCASPPEDSAPLVRTLLARSTAPAEPPESLLAQWSPPPKRTMVSPGSQQEAGSSGAAASKDSGGNPSGGKERPRSANRSVVVQASAAGAKQAAGQAAAHAKQASVRAQPTNGATPSGEHGVLPRNACTTVASRVTPSGAEGASEAAKGSAPSPPAEPELPPHPPSETPTLLHLRTTGRVIRGFLPLPPRGGLMPEDPEGLARLRALWQAWNERIAQWQPAGATPSGEHGVLPRNACTAMASRVTPSEAKGSSSEAGSSSGERAADPFAVQAFLPRSHARITSVVRQAPREHKEAGGFVLLHPTWLAYPFATLCTTYERGHPGGASRSSAPAELTAWATGLEGGGTGGTIARAYGRAVPVFAMALPAGPIAEGLLDAARRLWLAPGWAEAFRSGALALDGGDLCVPTAPPLTWALMRSFAVPAEPHPAPLPSLAEYLHVTLVQPFEDNLALGSETTSFKKAVRTSRLTIHVASCCVWGWAREQVAAGGAADGATPSGDLRWNPRKACTAMASRVTPSKAKGSQGHAAAELAGGAADQGHAAADLHHHEAAAAARSDDTKLSTGLCYVTLIMFDDKFLFPMPSWAAAPASRPGEDRGRGAQQQRGGAGPTTAAFTPTPAGRARLKRELDAFVASTRTMLSPRLGDVGRAIREAALDMVDVAWFRTATRRASLRR